MGTVAVKRNVLITSAGRRVELLRAFSRDLELRGIGSRIFTTDLNPKMSAACHVADQAFKMPRVTSGEYVEELLRLCEEQSVGLLVPTIDTELAVLSEARARFADSGVHVVVSDESLVAACRDKRLTAGLFHAIGVSTPQHLDRNRLTFPCFAKPYDGSRGVGAVKLNSGSEFTDAFRENPKLIFMEYIDSSYDEFTVDAYYSRHGDLRCLVPRHRLEVRDGEVSKAVTRRHHVYQYLKEKLAKIGGARGCLTVQLFAQPDGGRYAAIEINPRFGGGYPLTYAAGARFPGWLIDEYLLDADVPFFESWEADLLMLRYDAQVVIRDGV
jgi:carbamoyl-phosphate synthase large subunit